MAYDRACYDLAELFLVDEPALDTAAMRAALAQEIQDAIEAWLMHERRREGLEPSP